MFLNREDAAFQLAARLQDRLLKDPLVLAIPRGGVVLGAVLARELNADLDVVLARKLRSPYQPEAAVGAVGEDGAIYLDPFVKEEMHDLKSYLHRETQHQLQEIARRKKLLRNNRPATSVQGRSVIVTDDGIATGATMFAALHTLKNQQPHEVIVAIPVAPADRIDEFRPLCDELICLMTPEDFMAVGQFYKDFRQVEDEEVVQMLKPFAKKHSAGAAR